jgi:phenylalanyl-tRNA synthetase beta chain
MKFSEKWLREWVNPALDSNALVEKLTQAGLEVDAIEPVAGEFSGVVVGKVVSVQPHPDADKLRLTKVDVAADELLEIVCGASNVREGLKVPVAVIGSVLPGNFKIKKAKLRGIPSFGMLCSAKELGLAESADGLMELMDDAPVGTDFREYLDLDDVAIDVDLTPNRSDCLSIAGTAREVGVLTGVDLTPVSIEAATVSSQAKFEVVVTNTQACPRYLGRIIENVNVKAETPLWMQEKLRRSGLRSLGPVVDVTNYVMLELGQPMHAFDLAKLSGSITVRSAQQGEKLALIDGQEVTINTDTLVIADDNGPLALAGIMGGDASSVSDATQNIFLESAFFTPVEIAGRARSYGLHTDSSHRFERGVDPELPRQAIERATALLIDIVGGNAGEVTEVLAEDALPKTQQITLRASRIKRVLGIELDKAQVEEQLTRLGLTVTDNGDATWTVSVPSFRFDIAIEVDLIEELGRLYGYDLLPKTRPQGTVLTSSITEKQLAVARLQSLLVDRGYQEAITYSFVDPTIQQHFLAEGETAITLANPISADLSDMRVSLWPGLVKALTYNLNRQHDRVRLFEVGRIYTGSADNVEQQRYVGGILCGSRLTEQWAQKLQAIDFFDAKADVEALLACGKGEIEFIAESHIALHPGQSARIYKNGQAIGWLGAIHPKLHKSLGLDVVTYVFELALDDVLSAQVPEFEVLSKFPTNRRDLAIVVDRNITMGEIRHCLNSVDSDILKSIQLFDVYTGDGVEDGKKSLAIAFYLQHSERTLNDEEVDALMQTIANRLEQDVNAVIRG